MIGDSCVICSKTMCPTCCPIINDHEHVNKVLFTICSGGIQKKLTDSTKSLVTINLTIETPLVNSSIEETPIISDKV